MIFIRIQPLQNKQMKDGPNTDRKYTMGQFWYFQPCLSLPSITIVDQFAVGLIVLCTILRIALIFPLEIYSNAGSNHSNLIKAHEKLHNGTYSPVIEMGESIVASWGNAVFYYNWVIFIPAVYILPPLNLFLVGIDALFTVFISKATHYQTAVIPPFQGRL